MKRSLGSWSLVLILTFLAGLSSGAAQAALPPAIQARYVALSVMGYRYQVLFNSRGAPEARAKNLVAFAKTLPAVADARVLEDGLSVSGEFKDGIAFSFPYIYSAPSTPQPPKPATRGLSTTPTSGDQDPPTSLPLQPTQSESVANLVPITSISPSRQARVLYLAGTGGPGIRAAHELRDKLKAAGFEVPIPAGSASELPALRKVADDAVLYWNTHGGPDLFSSTPLTYANGRIIWMKTEERAEAEAEFAKWDHASDMDVENEKDLRLQRIIPQFAMVQDSTTDGFFAQWSYGITPEFIKYYWKLAPHATVYIDACLTNEDVLHKALFKANADAVLTWSGIFNGNYEPVRYFFDRMLGSNEVFPVDPPQRSFDAQSVWNKMLSLKLPKQPSGAQVNFRLKDGADSPIWVPSILGIDADAESNYLLLTGLFGGIEPKDPVPTVRFGNQVLVCKHSDSQMLMCPHPFAVGDVTVDYNDFRVSNPVKLEGWKVGFRMSVKDSVGQSTATLKVRLLGDLHAPHLFPDDLLVNGHPTLTQDPASISGSATLASNPDLGCDSGSAVLDPSKVNVTAFVDMERDPAHRLKWKISVGGQVGNCAADWSVSEDSGAYATVHDDLSVAAGQYTDPAEGGVHLEWDAFTPEVPMDPHAPR